MVVRTTTFSSRTLPKSVPFYYYERYREAIYVWLHCHSLQPTLLLYMTFLQYLCAAFPSDLPSYFNLPSCSHCILCVYYFGLLSKCTACSANWNWTPGIIHCALPVEKIFLHWWALYVVHFLSFFSNLILWCDHTFFKYLPSFLGMLF